jgi:hypothetical protein
METNAFVFPFEYLAYTFHSSRDSLINGRLYASFPDIEKFCLDAAERFPACANPYPILIDIACEKKNAADAAKVCCFLIVSAIPPSLILIFACL